VRKAVGATSHQVLAQFLIEAVVISFVGGIIGVFCSLIANFFIRVFTDLQPVITLPVMGIAVVVALLVGMVFGVAPALKAARKDPIQALRSVH
jgi:putative ABC transport system permease protein